MRAVSAAHRAQPAQSKPAPDAAVVDAVSSDAAALGADPRSTSTLPVRTLRRPRRRRSIRALHRRRIARRAALPPRPPPTRSSVSIVISPDVPAPAAESVHQAAGTAAAEAAPTLRACSRGGRLPCAGDGSVLRHDLGGQPHELLGRLLQPSPAAAHRGRRANHGLAAGTVRQRRIVEDGAPVPNGAEVLARRVLEHWHRAHVLGVQLPTAVQRMGDGRGDSATSLTPFAGPMIIDDEPRMQINEHHGSGRCT